MTYKEIYLEFEKYTNIELAIIDDSRPCLSFYGVPSIKNAILVWLKNGSKIIYIAKEKDNE